MDKFISNMRADAGLRLWYTRTHKKSEDEFYKWFDEENAPSLRKRVGTVVHGVCNLPLLLIQMTNMTILLFRPAQHPMIRPFATLSLLRNLTILLSPSAGGSATSLATTLISSTLKLESQYTLRLILQLITGSGDVGLNYSHSTRACVDVSKVEMLKPPHPDGSLNQARG